MNRRRADAVVGVVVGLVLVLGSALTWQAYRQRRALDQTMGSMMGSSMGSVHGTSPLWYIFGTLAVSVLVGGGYLVVRDDLLASEPTARAHEDPAVETAGASDERPVGSDRPDDEVDPVAQSGTQVLDLLPEDERRVLEPVLTSPGITQIELRDRSDFSKSKVSQTVSALEKRGLLYRERQGRTYRVYPSEDLAQAET